MIAKWELYGLVALGLILAAIAAGAWQRHVGYEEAIADQRELLDKANAKADAAEQRSQEISDHAANNLETVRTQHEAELDRVRKSLRYRLCELPAGAAQVPEAGGAAGGASAAKPGAAVPPNLASPDFLGNFVRACQNDADRIEGWRQWWFDQREALRAAFPDLKPAE